jgi:hypothetical protein
MKTTIKRLFALALIGCSIFSLAFSVSASDATGAMNGAMRGDAATVGPAESLAEQVEKLLPGSSPEQRLRLLEKAAVLGVDSADLPNVTLSKAEQAVLNGSASIPKAASANDKAILTAPGPATRATTIVAGVAMPDYALWPKIYKQERSDWCSAATIQTVLKYIGAASPAQSTIMNYWKSIGYTYPDLPLVRNYLNARLPSSYIDYMQYIYAGDQSSFNTCLKYDVESYQPMVLLMRNTSAYENYQTNWPYTTNGHFCICSGLLTWANNQYFIGDPYYFSSYVPGAGTAGDHNKTWTRLNKVIRNRFGSGQERIVF